MPWLGKLEVSSVVKAEWGVKRICQECGTKFYDMRRAEIVCPKCESVFKIVPPKPKRTQPAAKEAAVEEKPAVAKGLGPGGDTEETEEADELDDIEDLDDIDDIEDVVSDDDEDDDDGDMIEDASDLGDDDDDMAEVIQKPEPPQEL